MNAVCALGFCSIEIILKVTVKRNSMHFTTSTIENLKMKDQG